MTDLENTGPFVAAALLCELVLKEQDGVTSAIRVLDRLVVGSFGPAGAVSEEMPPQPITPTLLVMLKSGTARGSHQLRFTIELPSGQSSEMGSMGVLFEEGRGVEVIAKLNIVIGEAGVYWIDVFLEKVRLTRIPLQVVYTPMRAGGA